MKTVYRAHDCRFLPFTLANMRALLLENDLLRVVVLLDKGGDIIEFRHKAKDIDFMYHFEDGLRAPDGAPGAFLRSYEGGWQELFPNIGDACDYRGAALDVHGEAFMRAWDMDVLKDTGEEVSVRLSVSLQTMPFDLEKILTIRLHQPALFIAQRAVNRGGAPLPCMWGQHPALGGLFLASPVLIDMPKGRGVTYHTSFHPAFPANHAFDWPQAGGLDLSVMPAIQGKWAGLCALSHLSENWYACTSPSLGVGFGLAFDPAVYRHLWLWMVYNGYEHYPWYGRTRTIAIEPYSSLPDNLPGAIEAGEALWIDPGEQLETWVTAVCYAYDGHVRGIGRDGSVSFC